MFSQSFFHGTKADLKPGSLIVTGHQSNFVEGKSLSWVYFTATLDAAIWGPSCRQAVEEDGFMSWNQPDQSRTTPT